MVDPRLLETKLPGSFGRFAFPGTLGLAQRPPRRDWFQGGSPQLDQKRSLLRQVCGIGSSRSPPCWKRD